MDYKLGYYRTFRHNLPIVFKVDEICGDMDYIYPFFEEYAPYETAFKEKFWALFDDYYNPNSDLKKKVSNTFDAIMYCVKKLSDSDEKIAYLGKDYDWREGNDC